ncbi:MAG: hypothetical protein IT186_16905 [Acidobacteria bacterium]|nr:hypothetical protein [Acidobacteriota bacterium]
MRHLLIALVLASAPSVCLAAGAKQAPPREAAPLPQAAPAGHQNQMQKIEYLEPVVSIQRGPIAIGVDADVNCSGWIGTVDEKFPGVVFSADGIESRRAFYTGDIVYINLGKKQGVVAGQNFWIVRPESIIESPSSERVNVGRLYVTPGLVRVICVLEEDSMAEIIASCSDSALGDFILPYEPIPLPLVRRTTALTACDPPSGKTMGQIVYIIDAASHAGKESVVYIDLGEEDGLAPGDFFTVFRPRTSAGGTRTVLGEIAILKTTPKTAVAKVMDASDFIVIGDFIELK